jgi:hypothetical protein
MIALGQALGYGAAKYGDRNFEQGMDWSRMLGSLKRHITAFELGKDYDEESGLPNTYLILWNAMALNTYWIRAIGNDNRPDCGHDFSSIEEMFKPQYHTPESPQPPEETQSASTNEDESLGWDYLDIQERKVEAARQVHDDTLAAANQYLEGEETAASKLCRYDTANGTWTVTLEPPVKKKAKKKSKKKGKK